MHQLVKTLVAKLDDLSSVFTYHMERNDFYRLFCDLHMSRWGTNGHTHKNKT